MEFASCGRIFNACGEKKKISQHCIPPPQALYKNCPKGTASIYNL
jgi:hypothetical protein